MHRVEARLGIDHVDVVPGSALEDVVVQAAVQRVVSGAAIQSVGPSAAVEEIVVCASGERVVSVAAVQRVAACTSGQGVVARQPEDLVESRERVDGVVARRAHDQIVVRAGRQAEPERIEDLRLGENCGVAGEFQVEAPRSREAVPAHDDAVARRIRQPDEQVVTVKPEVQVAGRDTRQELNGIQAGRVGLGGHDAIGAVLLAEQVGVAARAAVEHIVDEIRPPVERIVTRSARQRISVVSAEQGVVAVTAVERVEARAAQQGVVTAQAPDGVVAIQPVDRLRGRRTDQKVAVIGGGAGENDATLDSGSTQGRAVGELKRRNLVAGILEPVPDGDAVGRTRDGRTQIVALVRDHQVGLRHSGRESNHVRVG